MAEHTCDVLCIGVLVADIFSSPLNRIPASGEIVIVEDLLLSTGGCATNMSIDLAKLGVKVGVVGKTGNDIFADFIAQDLQKKGVDTSNILSSPSAPTSRTMILPVIGEDRRYIHSVGANAEFKVSDIHLEKVSQAKVLAVGGYLLLPSFKQAELVELFKFARERGIKTLLDVAGVNPDSGLDPLLDVLPYTDAFLPNNDEAFLITGEKDPFKQAKIFVDCGVKVAGITRGGNGWVACTSQGISSGSGVQD